MQALLTSRRGQEAARGVIQEDTQVKVSCLLRKGEVHRPSQSLGSELQVGGGEPVAGGVVS